MTPGILAAKRTGIPYQIHDYHHDPAAAAFGLEAAEKLGVSVQQVFKTLVVSVETGELVVGIIPVASKLSMKRIAQAVGAKKAAMANAANVERSTGYVLGGVSPLGQKKKLRTVLDASARELPTIYVSAGRRGLEIELAPTDLANLTQATLAWICQTPE